MRRSEWGVSPSGSGTVGSTVNGTTRGATREPGEFTGFQFVITGDGGDDGLVGGDFSGDFGDPGSKLPDGNDTLEGGNGSDFAAGMLGSDTVRGGNGGDDLFGGPGPDSVSGGNGNDIVVGNFGNDTLSGGNGDDILDGDIVDGDDPAEDPNPNTDSCDGGRGENQLFFCEN